MQTTRLFAYQRPSRVEALLESLLQARVHLPGNARKVTDRSEQWQLWVCSKDGTWQQCTL